jgi:hypothetical protein
MADALRELHRRWREGTLDDAPLAEEWRRKVSRRARSQDFVSVLEAVVG